MISAVKGIWQNGKYPFMSPPEFEEDTITDFKDVVLSCRAVAHRCNMLGILSSFAIVFHQSTKPYVITSFLSRISFGGSG